jgi:hypothetical protein
LHLFSADTLAEWWQTTKLHPFGMADGLHRTVAELYFGGQTEETVEKAREWARQRANASTGAVFRELVERATPAILIDKSPGTALFLPSLERARRCSPGVRFLHLTRHPRGYCDSVLKAYDRSRTERPLGSWIERLVQGPGGTLDPQHGWLHLHRGILTFLRTLPAEQQLRLRAEDLVDSPDDALPALCRFLGVRHDAEALAGMRHPERWRFAGPGPANAPGGGDYLFQASPSLREIAPHAGLEGLLPEVRRLAERFGYR